MPFFLQLPNVRAKTKIKIDKKVVFKKGTFYKRTKLHFIRRIFNKEENFRKWHNFLNEI
jgi:hypothetical protein